MLALVVTAKQLPSRYEGLLLQDDQVDLVRLLEDEILLQLPIVARHDVDDCQIKLGSATEVDDQRQHPFVDLQKKMGDN